MKLIFVFLLLHLCNYVCVQSLFRWASISTLKQKKSNSFLKFMGDTNLQMGHLLFWPSHWSTHSTWKRWKQGSLLTSSSTSNSDRQIVHLSPSSSSSSPTLLAGKEVLLVNLWGRVFLSIQDLLAPLFMLPPALLASISLMYSCENDNNLLKV